MPLNTIGPISFGGTDPSRSINAQFLRASNAKLSLGQLYRGGGIVPASTPQNANVPTSGRISLGNLRGASRRRVLTITYTVNTLQAIISLPNIPDYLAGSTDLVVYISPDVYVYSDDTAVAGLTLLGGAEGDTLIIENHGFIIGRGGNGGGGPNAGGHGQAGGPALSLVDLAAIPTTVLNQPGAYIAGGGGGGAGNASGGGGGGGGGAGGGWGGQGIAGGGPGEVGANSGARTGRGGGGGRVLPGKGGTGANSNNNYNAQGGGAGGGGGNNRFNGYSGGNGGSANGNGSGPGERYAACGGGGWAATSGSTWDGYVSGAGGAAIKRTHAINLINNGVIYGTV